jgi:opacity protein-like surface antigen
MKNTLLALALISVTPSIVYADDAALGSQTGSFWDGFYAGVHGGFGIGSSDHVPDVGGPGYDFDISGAVGGVQVGFLTTTDGNGVLGVEGDWSWSGIGGSCDVDGFPQSTFPSAQCTSGLSAGAVGQSIDWTGSLRARAGVDLGTIQPYVTGGVAVARGTRSFTNPSDDVTTDSQTHFGWTAGVGVDVMMSDTTSFGASYLYAAYGPATYDLSGGLPEFEPVTLNTHTVRFSINKHVN